MATFICPRCKQPLSTEPDQPCAGCRDKGQVYADINPPRPNFKGMRKALGETDRKETGSKIRLGVLAGKVKVSDDFDQPLDLLPSDALHPPVVVIDPAIMGGVACLAGSRLPAKTLLDMIDAGNAWERIVASWPWLTKAHVEAARIWAKTHGDS